MNANLKKEEYTTLARFVRISFIRDQPQILTRFPTLDAAFLTEFTAKLEEVKSLETGIVLTEDQKDTTESLRDEADFINKELNFLVSYTNDAGLDSKLISDLKKDLTHGNIEGAVFKMEGVRQFVQANSTALQQQGMAIDFPAFLQTHKASLETKNTLQYKLMNSRKKLTSDNLAQYKALYAYTTKVMKAGKLFFAKTITKDQYTISKTVSRMRGGKHKVEPKENKSPNTSELPIN